MTIGAQVKWATINLRHCRTQMWQVTRGIAACTMQNTLKRGKNHLRHHCQRPKGKLRHKEIHCFSWEREYLRCHGLCDISFGWRPKSMALKSIKMLPRRGHLPGNKFLMLWSTWAVLTAYRLWAGCSTSAAALRMWKLKTWTSCDRTRGNGFKQKGGWFIQEVFYSEGGETLAREVVDAPGEDGQGSEESAPVENVPALCRQARLETTHTIMWF